VTTISREEVIQFLEREGACTFSSLQREFGLFDRKAACRELGKYMALGVVSPKVYIPGGKFVGFVLESEYNDYFYAIHFINRAYKRRGAVKPRRPPRRQHTWKTKILDMMMGQGEFTTVEISETLGIGVPATRKFLESMLKQGKVNCKSASPGGQRGRPPVLWYDPAVLGSDETHVGVDFSKATAGPKRKRR
jgi:predicted HTH transcriptional regulator